MYSLARLKQIEEEKKAKKLEREKKKKEKEREKKRLKSLERQRKTQLKCNKKYYHKKRKEELARRAANGDENGFFTILLTKNKKRFKSVGRCKWKTDAYKIYNDAIAENEKEVKFPVKYHSTDECQNNSVIYEIIIMKKVNDNENTVAHFRNDSGKFVSNVIVDKPQNIIVDKHIWLVEETFHVYGYHPLRDRKTYDFIFNEILLNDIEDKYDIRTVLTYQNKLLIKYTDDFDFVLCKTPQEAQRLSLQIEKDIPKHLKKNIMVIGEINKNLVNELVDKMVDKTGWTREQCTKANL